MATTFACFHTVKLAVERHTQCKVVVTMNERYNTTCSSTNSDTFQRPSKIELGSTASMQVSLKFIMKIYVIGWYLWTVITGLANACQLLAAKCCKASY
jgi:hypothetical protein